MADHNRRSGDDQREIRELLGELPLGFGLTAGVGDQMSGALIGIIVFVDHGRW